MRLLPLPLVAAIIFNILMVIALILSTSVTVQVRVLLINLLVAILLCATSYSLSLVMGISRELSEPFCRFSIWLYGVALQARVCGLVVFSVMVFRTVKHGMRQNGAKWLIVILLASWTTSLLIPIDICIPHLDEVRFVECKACFPGPLEGENLVIRLVFISIKILISYILPLLICFCILLGILCYIKRHTISEAEYKLAKFAAFLIPGSIINIMGQVVLPTIAFVMALPNADIVGVYLAYIVSLLSFFPTPILIFVYLKSVRICLCHNIICRKCRKHNEAIPMQQAETIPVQQAEIQF